MEISPNVHLIPNVIANPYLIVDPDGLTLIDAGLPGSQKKMLEYMAARGYRPQDLRRILITHADTDHVGGLAALKRRTGARVYASAVEAAAIARGEPSRPRRSAQFGRRLLLAVTRMLVKPAPVEVEEIVAEGQVLPILGGLQVLETPGHTPGHISLFSPSAGVLFTGDSIVSRPAGLVGSLPALTWDAGKAADSVQKQATLRARVVCSGHGPVVSDAIGKMPGP